VPTSFSARYKRKRLELLRDLIPTVRTVGFVFDPETPREDIEPTARRLGLRLYARSAATEDDLDAAFAAFADRRVDAVLVGTSPRIFAWRMRIVGLAANPLDRINAIARRTRVDCLARAVWLGRSLTR
jgi:ABC-type uncharacterized transport system substrate-binding protein